MKNDDLTVYLAIAAMVIMLLAVFFYAAIYPKPTVENEERQGEQTEISENEPAAEASSVAPLAENQEEPSQHNV